MADLKDRADEPPYRVFCVRQDGRERLFNRYATQSEAQAVADALARVGCATRIATPDEQLLEVRA